MTLIEALANLPEGFKATGEGYISIKDRFAVLEGIFGDLPGRLLIDCNGELWGKSPRIEFVMDKTEVHNGQA